MKSLAVLTLVLIGLVLFGERATAQIPISCVIESFDAKQDDDTLWWKAVTKCDTVANESKIDVEIEEFDWAGWPNPAGWTTISDKGNWTDRLIDWHGRNGTFSVTPYLGLHCVRINSLHLIDLLLAQALGFSRSGGRCF